MLPCFTGNAVAVVRRFFCYDRIYNELEETAKLKKYGLPHINPHAFRYTMVSLLYYNGVDPITISKRLGHSKVSATTDKYGHIMARAYEAATECIANFVIRRKEDQ